MSSSDASCHHSRSHLLPIKGVVITSVALVLMKLLLLMMTLLQMIKIWTLLLRFFKLFIQLTASRLSWLREFYSGMENSPSFHRAKIMDNSNWQPYIKIKVKHLSHPIKIRSRSRIRTREQYRRRSRDKNQEQIKFYSKTIQSSNLAHWKKNEAASLSIAKEDQLYLWVW